MRAAAADGVARSSRLSAIDLSANHCVLLVLPCLSYCTVLTALELATPVRYSSLPAEELRSTDPAPIRSIYEDMIHTHRQKYYPSFCAMLRYLDICPYPLPLDHLRPALGRDYQASVICAPSSRPVWRVCPPPLWLITQYADSPRGRCPCLRILPNELRAVC